MIDATAIEFIAFPQPSPEASDSARYRDPVAGVVIVDRVEAPPIESDSRLTRWAQILGSLAVTLEGVAELASMATVVANNYFEYRAFASPTIVEMKPTSRRPVVVGFIKKIGHGLGQVKYLPEILTTISDSNPSSADARPEHQYRTNPHGDGLLMVAGWLALKSERSVRRKSPKG